ncbi:hypothetical protein GCM10007897_45000 [Sphingobium jiangsuense]|uniref:Uncharacterized protein n=1 Tax=Sphingobium jiangsuense TaxID=870476 RepID=A0A7W6BUB8_9SPHN|nr:hypothetical protein [Sphingobium jiangsuense]MBB3928973.1 hypothetical protein [Sphingobium jiangsuense]GLT03057.1 hypothetical protein GCM10007897_45000 [Sphingobium jiangsuense]
MDNFYNESRPVIENGKLVFVSNGGSRAIVGIQQVRKTVKALEGKSNLRPSSLATLELYRAGIALWEANR